MMICSKTGENLQKVVLYDCLPWLQNYQLFKDLHPQFQNFDISWHVKYNQRCTKIICTGD